MSRIEEALRKAKANRVGSVPYADPAEMDIENSPRQQLSETSTKSAAEYVPSHHHIECNASHLREERVIAALDNDDRVGPYRQLRTQLLKTMHDRNWNTLAITSANEGAGKTLTAANLSIALSRHVNTSVLLVDLDLNTPSIHEKLNIRPEKGLVDYLEGRATLDEVLFDPGIDGLTVLTGKSAGRQSSELLASPRMQGLMQELCNQDVATITIFDLPPLLRNDDAILFAPFADATLLIVEESVTTTDEIEEAMRLLERANCIGTLLNKSAT